MVKLVALSRLRYNRRDYQAGDKFEADDRFAKAITLVRKARLDDSKPTKLQPSPPAPPPLKYEPAPAEAMSTTNSEELTLSKRRYNRRDMAATEDGDKSS